jgi:cytochrome c
MAGSSASAEVPANSGVPNANLACPHDDSGLELPPGFCATGTALGPNLTDTQWLWGDGSYRAIAKTIAAGVPEPKVYRAPMPPMGGAELTPDQVSAVAAYVWGLSHRAP